MQYQNSYLKADKSLPLWLSNSNKGELYSFKVLVSFEMWTNQSRNLYMVSLLILQYPHFNVNILQKFKWNYPTTQSVLYLTPIYNKGYYGNSLEDLILWLHIRAMELRIYIRLPHMLKFTPHNILVPDKYAINNALRLPTQHLNRELAGYIYSSMLSCTHAWERRSSILSCPHAWVPCSPILSCPRAWVPCSSIISCPHAWVPCSPILHTRTHGCRVLPSSHAPTHGCRICFASDSSQQHDISIASNILCSHTTELCDFNLR